MINMKMNNKIITTLFLMGIAFLFVGCTIEDGPIQLANPASEFCIKNGGKLEIRTGELGEYGICVFEDKSECEEWDFFQNSCKPSDNPNGFVHDFESCTRAGNPILESYPEKCIHEGITYTRKPNSIEEICIFNNGTWLDLYKECEGISKDICESTNGVFNECASACRNNPDTEICTMQCVIVCKY